MCCCEHKVLSHQGPPTVVATSDLQRGHVGARMWGSISASNNTRTISSWDTQSSFIYKLSVVNADSYRMSLCEYITYHVGQRAAGVWSWLPWCLIQSTPSLMVLSSLEKNMLLILWSLLLQCVSDSYNSFVVKLLVGLQKDRFRFSKQDFVIVARNWC